MNFTDKVIVITGGSNGFGLGLAEVFIQQNATVIVTSNNENHLKAASRRLGCDYYVADAATYDDCLKLANVVCTKYTHVDVWVNNAGIQIAPALLEDVDINKLHKLFNVNFFGYFYGCKAILPRMKQRGSGAIININSTAGLSGKPQLSAYTSSKFAIKGMTEALRQELKSTGIDVYQIFPGGMKTDIYNEKVPSDFSDYMDIEYAIDKIMHNFSLSDPELDLIIKRPAI